MGSEIIFIFLLALILFGPKKLPAMARELGKFVAEFKRASNDFKQQLQAEIERAGAEDYATASGRSVAQQSGGTSGTTSLPPASSPSIQPPALAAATGTSSGAQTPAPYANEERLLQSARMAYDSKGDSERKPLVPDTASAPPPAPMPPRPRPAVNKGAEESAKQGAPAAADAVGVPSPSSPPSADSNLAAETASQGPQKG